tara:strand:- start:3923 stop:4168 length:246 start_codon:yes stop_codon:yes gene_type:complete
MEVNIGMVISGVLEFEKLLEFEYLTSVSYDMFQSNVYISGAINDPQLGTTYWTTEIAFRLEDLVSDFDAEMDSSRVLLLCM